MSCLTLVTPWAVAFQAPLAIRFSRQEYWRGLPFPSPRDLPNMGIEPRSPALQADSLLTKPPGNSLYLKYIVIIQTHKPLAASLMLPKMGCLCHIGPVSLFPSKIIREGHSRAPLPFDLELLCLLLVALSGIFRSPSQMVELQYVPFYILHSLPPPSSPLTLEF